MQLIVRLELHIERSVVVTYPTLQCPNGLVVLHDLNGRHRLGRHMLRSLIVLVAHQVESLNVELIDRLSLVKNLSCFGDFDTWQATNDILQTDIVLLTEGIYVVIERILPPRNGFCPNGHSLDGL